jgi:Zn-dependent protease with chaperone function
MNIRPEQFETTLRKIIREETSELAKQIDVEDLKTAVDTIAVGVQTLTQKLAVHRNYEHPTIEKRLARLENHTGLSAD